VSRVCVGACSVIDRTSSHGSTNKTSAECHLSTTEPHRSERPSAECATYKRPLHIQDALGWRSKKQVWDLDHRASEFDGCLRQAGTLSAVLRGARRPPPSVPLSTSLSTSLRRCCEQAVPVDSWYFIRQPRRLHEEVHAGCFRGHTRDAVLYSTAATATTKTKQPTNGWVSTGERADNAAHEVTFERISNPDSPSLTMPASPTKARQAPAGRRGQHPGVGEGRRRICHIRKQRVVSEGGKRGR
jgi:hypothetical protein